MDCGAYFTPHYSFSGTPAIPLVSMNPSAQLIERIKKVFDATSPHGSKSAILKPQSKKKIE